MAKFRITSPDGAVYDVDAPDGATEQDALAYVQAHHSGAQQAAQPLPATEQPLPATETDPQQNVDPVGRFLGLSHRTDTGIANAVRQGMTLGLDDEIGAGANALGKLMRGEPGGFAQNFDTEVAARRAKTASFAAEHPVGSFAATMAGSIPTVPIGAGAGLTRALTAGSGVLKRGAIAGAKYGAALTPGSADINLTDPLIDTAGKLNSALDWNVLTGALGGGLLAKGANLTGKLARWTYDKMLGHGSPQASALTTMRQGILQDMGPDAFARLREQVTPDLGKMRITPEQTRTVLDAFSRAHAANGGDNAAARQTALATYRASNPTVSASTQDKHVGAILKQYGAENRVPLTVEEMVRSGSVDTATQAPNWVGQRGEAPRMGRNTHWLFRAALRSSGAEANKAAETLAGRQAYAGRDMSDLIKHAFGDPNYQVNYEGLQRGFDAVNNHNYAQALQQEKPFSLMPLIARYQTMRVAGAIRGQIDWALEQLAPGMKVQGGPSLPNAGRQMFNLTEYRQGRRLITERILGLKAAGQREEARILTGLKMRADVTVRQSNPEWWKANQAAADGFAVLRAAEDGHKLSIRPNTTTERILRRYSFMAPQEQEAFRMGFSRQLHDLLGRQGDTHDVSKAFRTGENYDEGARRIISRILDLKTSERFFSDVQRMHTGRETYNTLGGAQSEPLAEARKALNQEGRLASVVKYFNPLRYPEIASELGERIFNRHRNDVLLRNLMRTTDKPHEIMRLLDQLEAHVPRAAPRGPSQVQRALPALTARAGQGTSSDPGQ